MANHRIRQTVKVRLVGAAWHRSRHRLSVKALA